MSGFLAQAGGAVTSGATIMALQYNHHWTTRHAYQFVMAGYACFGAAKFAIYCENYTRTRDPGGIDNKKRT